jgi:hypothetical protein
VSSYRQNMPGSSGRGAGSRWRRVAGFLTAHPTNRPGVNWSIWALALLVATSVIAGAAGSPTKTAANGSAGPPTAGSPADTTSTQAGSTTTSATGSTPVHRTTRATPSSPRPAATGGDVVRARGLVLPNPVRTPGAINRQVTQASISTTICVSGWTATIRPPSSYTTALKEQQLATGYAYHGDQITSDYEEDHLISLELGGSPRSVPNLWPEPYAGTDGARLKDQIENKLHDLVCAGTVSLATARHAIASNWYAAYASYIGTQTPASSTHSAPTASRSAPATTSALACRASMSNPHPVDYSTTDVIVHTGVAGATVTATAYYKTTDTSHTSTAAGNGTADIPFRISRATPGYTVEVDVNVHAHGASRSCTTSFTAQ